MGPITALTWALEVGDTSRFRSIKQAISYCGLCGAEKSSADKAMRTPISKQRNKHIQQVMVERQRPMQPNKFAEQALRAVAKNQAIIVIPRWWKLAWWLNRLSPSIGFYLGRKMLETAKRAVDKLPPAAEPASENAKLPETAPTAER